jgi:hypothetical protein
VQAQSCFVEDVKVGWLAVCAPTTRQPVYSPHKNVTPRGWRGKNGTGMPCNNNTPQCMRDTDEREREREREREYPIGLHCVLTTLLRGRLSTP